MFCRLMEVELDQATDRQLYTTTVDTNGDDGWFGGWFGGGEESTTPLPAPTARSVEQCQCPVGYVGSSCQVNKRSQL